MMTAIWATKNPYHRTSKYTQIRWILTNLDGQIYSQNRERSDKFRNMWNIKTYAYGQVYQFNSIPT